MEDNILTWKIVKESAPSCLESLVSKSAFSAAGLQSSEGLSGGRVA